MKKLSILISTMILLCGYAYGQELKQEDTGKYKLFVAGSEIGKASYEVTKSDDQGAEIKGNLSFTTADGQVISVESTTILAPRGAPKSFFGRYTQAQGEAEPASQEVTVVFEEGKAKAKVTSGGSETEQEVELPEKWILQDNNNLAHAALLVRHFKPDMEPIQTQAFIPQALTLVDYRIEPLGEAEFSLGKEAVSCQAYKMIIAERIEFKLYVSKGQLIGAESEQPQVRLELVTK